jgi:hypothetical protein
MGAGAEGGRHRAPDRRAALTPPPASSSTAIFDALVAELGWDPTDREQDPSFEWLDHDG